MTIFFNIIAILTTLMLAATVILILFGDQLIDLSLWWERKRRKNQNADKCLRDYPDRYDAYGLIEPTVDGLIDRELMWDLHHKSYETERAPDRISFLGRMNRQFCRSFEERYFTPGMDRAYKRGLKSLKMYASKRHYYSFDEEFQALCELALEVKKKDCLKCDNQGGRWLPEGAACQSYHECDCEYAKNPYQ